MRLSGIGSGVAGIFRREVREGLRNRRALFLAFGLPLVLYPGLVFLFTTLERQQFEVMENQPAEVSVIAPANDSLASATIRWLEGDSRVIVRHLTALPEDSLTVAPGTDLMRGEHPDTSRVRRAIRADSVDALILLLPRAQAGPHGGELPLLGVFFEGRSEESFARTRRVTASLDSLRGELFELRARLAGVMNPWRDMILVVHDSSMRIARSGRYLGSILPFLIMFIALTGGSYIALDAVAGERERGTLESLLSQPVHRLAIVAGKALAVFCASGVAVVTAGIGLLLGSAFMPLESMEGVEMAFPETSALVEGMLASIPLVLEIAAALMIVSALARSYKEAQNYMLPLSLLLMVAGVLSTSSRIPFSPGLSLIPLTGQAFAIRELLSGGGDPLLIAASSVSGTVYGLAGLFWASEMLSGEGILIRRQRSRPPKGVSPARRAIVLGLAVLLGLYYLSGLLAGWSPLLGIAVTEWGFLMIMATGFVLVFGLRPSSVGLRPASSISLGVALASAVPLAVLAAAVLLLQSILFPIPASLSELMKPIARATVAETVLILSLTPAVCEELLFRGVIMRQMAREISQPRAVVVSAVLFGAFHLSIYRFLPTLAVGLALGWLSFASGSILPAILLHACYNLAARYLIPESLQPEGLLAPALIASLAVLAALGVTALRRGKRDRGPLVR
ncbi:CPBP family intramembrane metalloprotease [Candidatus Fermentibacterales bacterium]|nr:CPBP family intramembrane metalloprotease [Candidatus Fermentibacterales bacterium]